MTRVESAADIFDAIPKVELHCHVEGASRATTIKDLADSHGVAFPVEDPADLYEFTSLNQFLSIYDVICASLQTADDFRRITYEALEDGVAAGVRYREMFFSPGFVIRLGVPVETVWEGVRAGLADAHRDLDIKCRMILDFDKPSNPLVRAVYLAYLTFVGSTLGLLLHGDWDTYRYIPESIRRYPGAVAVNAMIRTAGFSSSDYIPVLGGLMAIHRACAR